jgi:hypothetical protein
LFDKSVIKRTNQGWKLMLSLACIVAGFVLVGGLHEVLPGFAFVGFGPRLLIGFILWGIGLVFPCVAIRCPQCGARWFWQGISGRSVTNWFPWLVGRSTCPNCEYEPVY